MKRALIIPAAIMVALAGPRPAAADSVVSVQIENDVIFGTDRNFTNGVRFTHAFEEGREWQWVGKFLDFFPPLREKGGSRRVTLALGQSMFTPKDTETAALIMDDRPYAGWLYFGIGGAVQKGNRLDIFEIEAGVIGPDSQAERFQRWWHGVIGAEKPKGWANQLRDEPGFVAYFQRSWKFHNPASPVLRHFDLTPHLGGAVGNVFTYAAGGVTVRFGSDLTRDFDAPPRIKPSLPGADAFLRTQGFEWYLFAGVEARGIARNIFLDGNTFRDSHSVPKRHLVADFQAGLAIMYRRVRLSFTTVVRSDEFVGQVGGHHFGAVTLSARF